MDKSLQTTVSRFLSPKPKRNAKKALVERWSELAVDSLFQAATNTGSGDQQSEIELNGENDNSGIESNFESYSDMVSVVKRRVVLSGLRQNMWTTQHEHVIQTFLFDRSLTLLVVFMDAVTGLHVDLAMPGYPVHQLCYFIKADTRTWITKDNFRKNIQYGTVKGNYVESLLGLMQGVYAPTFFKNSSWPDSIKSDFSGALYKFMANLTDTRYKMEGHTVLYVPVEGLDTTVEVAARKKEFVQRLETAMIHWTRQIKEVLSSQESIETGENAGPLEEIEFWRSRCEDLSGLSHQLDQPGVKKIRTILELSRSSYVGPFLKLSRLIQNGSAQAQENLHFLSILKEPCEILAHSSPRDIPGMLTNLLNMIRMIWVNSQHYNDRERLTGLFRKMCECSRHFLRMDNGTQIPVPSFSGQRGPEVAQTLLETEKTFSKRLDALKKVRKTILDVKATSWHDDYNRFRSGIKDLEVMMQNLISTAFDTVSTVQEGVELLDLFQHLTARETIKRTIDKKTVQMWTLFSDELNSVKKELATKSPPLSPMHPNYAGCAHWAKALKRRIDYDMAVLDSATFLPHTGSGDEARIQYRQLAAALDEYTRKVFDDWASTVDREPGTLLDAPLMCRSSEKPGMLDINFDRSLLKLFQEIYYWERLMFEIPHYAADVYSKKEDLRNLCEQVLLVVRDYNRIISALSPEERGLFRERIRFLDKKVHPGLTKLTWASKGVADFYIADCRQHALRVQAMVDDYKNTNIAIFQNCKKISEVLLFNIDNKKVYENNEFEDEQTAHRKTVQRQLKQTHDDIVATLKNTYDIFRNDGPEVQTYWLRYLDKVDCMVEEAFRLNIKWSLQELSRAINGDGKSSPNPLFKVKVVLERNRVNFNPKLLKLASLVSGTMQELASTVAGISRLPDLLSRRPTNKEPIYKMIEQDEESKKIQASINNGMTLNAQNLQEYLKTWDEFKEIWEINKDAFIRRYERLKPSVASFDADISRYTEVANNVQSQETILNIQFVLLDCSLLKYSVLGHCSEWQNKFTALLAEIAANKLNEIHKYLEKNSERVSVPPTSLDELGDGIGLLEKLQEEMAGIEAKFHPLNEQFEILRKYEVTIPEKVESQLGSLPEAWSVFQHTLLDADEMLKKHKDKFKTGLIHSSEDFKKQVGSLVEEFIGKGPFVSGVASVDALDDISAFRQQLLALKQQEASIRRGLGLFKIDQPPSKDIQNLDKDLEYLEMIWELSKEWEGLWHLWKQRRFVELVTDDMEVQAQGILKRLVKLSRELKEKSWEVVEFNKARLEQFKRTMPLIQSLKNPAMRQRHWDDVKDTVCKSFDHRSEEFTLEQIIMLGFDQYVDKIGDVSAAASKELSIEEALDSIRYTWETMALDITPYKERGHFRLKATDDVFQALDDNQVTLSTMKASRYVVAFESDVDYWERTLSHILEVIEILLTVQRQWMYLENIFLGEDIRKQLPRESAEFDEVNSSWKTIMTRISRDTNALRGTHHDRMLEQLTNMNAKLEDIQKSLDMYLETKRQIFPRFYFLSNDDLLEILGQSKNPSAVQTHLKKCFDNIKSLKMGKVSSSITQKFEASGMYSADGEFVDFVQPVLLEGAVEVWLCDVERTMRWTLKEQLKQTRLALKKNISKRDKWVKDWPGQLCITASQVQWTTDCTKALALTKERGDKKPLKSIKKKQVAMLDKFSEAIRGNLTKQQRAKIVALVTIEVHARDVIEKMIKTGCNDVTAFEWLSQLRLYWDKDIDDCIVRQTNTQFQYGYEYLGNSGRLVITPLTDRCYMTLTTALHLHRGGSPKGPAGTGKTETIKDLGKALGMYVIVVNCSEGLDYKSMGRMYSGLAQTGAWGCFDEFNRINIEVLSVVAQQILSILSALSAAATRFVFEGRSINLMWSCGIFITMNPGYAGRTELPDNLKSMFRPISMVVPDSAMIAEIMLFGEGFSNTKILAKKVQALFSLAVRQLSKQDHYEFGLRGLVSVLRYAGRKKRDFPNMPDEEVLLLAMKDMNVAKLTASDLPLFNGIVSDLFPGVETHVIDYEKLKEAILAELKEAKLQPHPITILKIIQLAETKNSRHSCMIVGYTGSGKSVVWRMLQAVMCRLKRQKEPGYNYVKEFPINPKALSLGELYGEFDLNTNEWTDGILSSVMRQTCADEKPDEKWLLFDGPVDTLWIESMNSVMDDNKVLTLINGERIAMPDQVSLLFECEDLSVASPATVSRCGMVYIDSTDLGWKPYVDSWLGKKMDKKLAEELRRLFDKYLAKVLEFRCSSCKESVPISQLNGVVALCRLFDALATEKNGVDPVSESFVQMIELWFMFSMIWSVCASVDEESRKKMDNYLRELEGSFPAKDTVYEYYVDVKNKTWALWEDKLKAGWKYSPSMPFYRIIVPTVDTVRYDFLVSNLIQANCPVLVTGPVGTGKTSIVQNVLGNLDSKTYSILTVNMSAQTTSNNVQDIIESRVEKRTKGVYVPVGGRRLITFMDDFNMPAKDTFGSQPPLELMRQWLDYGFWYDRQKQIVKYIKDMLLLVSMGPPGGGRTIISKRLQSRFNLINMTFPHESQIKRIFGSMITQKLQDFEEDVKPIAEVMTQATIDMYNLIVARMLPTPTKIHYLFNLRDISKVFQGLLRAHKDFHDTKHSMTRLWIHECFRVFHDRLVDDRDSESFVAILSDKLGTMFDTTFHNVCPNKQPPIFGEYCNDNGIYEDFQDFKQLKVFMENQLEDFNMTPGIVSMDLVLFRDAIEHISRIIRVIRQPRGNMLLVGIGGSGRQSLTRLATFISGYKCFQIEVTRLYRTIEFKEDLRNLYWLAGVENKHTVFLFTDTQVVEEMFLEFINNMLSSGEVPNLYKPEEFEEVKNALSEAARNEGIPETPESIFSFLVERVRSNLHVVLCMSPVGDAFRNRLRMYPAFVNCTTIDWFSEWPADALLEVADKYLESIDLPSEEIKTCVASVFTVIHRSVVDQSKRMLVEMKRHNYVTPTNYLELVSGYKALLSEKRMELGNAANKLRNGLDKIDDTRSKVEVMSVELEEAKVKVAQFQKQCEEYLVTLVQQKREADEQQKSVSARSEKIGVEELRCKQIATGAQQELDEAIPALQEAIRALESLNKKDMTEIKSYGRPPALVEKVMEAVMILRGGDPSWAEAKRQLGEANFLAQLMNFDKDSINDRVLKKIDTYCANPDFDPDIIGRVSSAAKSLCMWVRAMDKYGHIFRVVEPKRQKLEGATSQLSEKQASLAAAKAKLKEVTDKMEDLKKQYDEKLAQKEDLRRKAEQTELKLDRAGKLVEGLSGEKDRWEASVQKLDEQIQYLVGDCLVAAGFMSYMGPFLSNYRDELVNNIWLEQIKKLGVPCTPTLSFCEFLAKATTVRDWNIQGLPNDAFSTENGVIVSRCSRWPLMIDPQGQAIKWIKNMEHIRGLKIIDLQQTDYLRTLENSIQFGTPVLLQNVQEELDPSLAPVLNKSIIKQGGRLLIKLGDKEVEYNPEFRFYITTKLSNPHYTPEIATKTTVVNFAVKEQGLEAQLLGIVVRKERPELEEQKDSLVINIAAGKKKLVELEDEILRLLNEAQGSLLDDEALVNTLQNSKTTSKEVEEQLLISEETEIKIDAAREGYRSCAQRASILFFVLNDMGRIDPMYQFSLDAYIDLFNMSIDKSQRSTELEERIQHLNDYHTYAVYRYTCRGLFERHKLLFSFQMCAKITEVAGKLNIDEYNFFLRGGVVLDKEGQMDNPCPLWIVNSSWDNITELDKLTNFHGIATSFEQYPRDWNIWFTSPEPEQAHLPGEWENQCNELQRMLVVRSLRPDRISFCVTSFIVNNLGSKFVEPPVLDMNAVLESSSAKTPLIFVLSTGVDPTSSLLQLAENAGMANRFHALSLGQGQAPIATRMIKDGIREGKWVYLANCHLSLSWMPQLDKLVEQLQVEEPHQDFRLWLSSSPHPDFPISILQAGIKMTTEPPKGLRANMKRLYQLMTEPQFTHCRRPDKYKKLLFGLCFFHSILLERRKFLQLGWNIPYGFNDSDFEVSENLLSIYLDEYDDTPWEALKYLIAGVNYGGHVTDDFDRRLLNSYIQQIFCEEAIATTFFKLSSLPVYYIPKDGPLQSYREYINLLPAVDHPDAFGQHPNADISSQIIETRTLFDTLLSLKPQVSAVQGGVSQEDKVLEMAADVLRRIPPDIDYDGTAKLLSTDPSPLNVVLLQEIQRYNALLQEIRTSLIDLEKGIKGLVVMSADLEEIFTCINDGRVPPAWAKTYPSLKSLGTWTRDLVLRIDQFETWATRTHPPTIFWLSGFTFPTGFLTAVLQTAARQNNTSVDSLSWEFVVSTTDDSMLLGTGAPKDGVYIKGMYLEGAGWNKKDSCLIEAKPMQLVCPMPTIHFKPIDKKRSSKGVYACPCYYYGKREGSYIVTIDLKAGTDAADHWTKRGTALLMSLEN
ncbi:PREDICTED: dynein heavy chain 2, axonemal-like [Priapulus caudatus]|uniref:Dynein heavy chain 2, axonemal-like n=1 Tax=Priapulus caudatus TaxID=37621 RepID=A0ABM1F8V2_PRICU|nr:PREDICTED: dynein heavy chain 2, axonemal-like [Priapulus caudatus]